MNQPTKEKEMEKGKRNKQTGKQQRGRGNKKGFEVISLDIRSKASKILACPSPCLVVGYPSVTGQTPNSPHPLHPNHPTLVPRPLARR
ncbi:hypothetical protein C0Q70_02235 [Pomacea canaliculata]|uniref:Uncharacterized protein n=1 Tax=Pomacea canaliculata TaxID=400727 RepID=A0A2T7Q1T1_POMCA|nr:hypothetical protein C0Q70_02235 [Pomacea canaliculata]